MKLPSSFTIIYASGAVTIGAILFKLYIFDAILEGGIKRQKTLKPGNEIRDMYLKIPFPLEFKVYFFNVTNPEPIQIGAKPILQEIGPYWYEKFVEKVDIVDNETADTLTYTSYETYYFNPKKSLPFKEDDIVTILNPGLMSMVNVVIENTPAFVSIIKQAIAPLFNNPETIFLTAKVKDILFDGLELNCTNKQFPVSQVCSTLKTKVPGLKLKPDDKDIYLLSLFGSRNATKRDRVTVQRGSENIRNVGKLMDYNGVQRVNMWRTEECNRFDGTDGWIFPPLTRSDENLKSFSMDLCRNFDLKPKKIQMFNNIPAMIYEGNMGDQTNNPEDKCYCKSPDNCLKKGLFDTTKCLGMPVYTTLPHFLDTDEEYLNKVEGLHPVADKHKLRVYFEAKTGTPLSAARKLQFNFFLHKTDKIELFANLPEVLFPLFWMDESVNLPVEILQKVEQFFLISMIANSLQYITIFAGIMGILWGFYRYYKTTKKLDITTIIKPVMEQIHNNQLEIDAKSKY